MTRASALSRRKTRSITRFAPCASLVLALSGCASRALVDERSTEPYARWIREDATLDAHPVWVRVPTSVGPWDVRVREVRSRDPVAWARPVVVLLNGAFSDGGTWRFVTGTLAAKHHLLVVDFPGTGGSTGPDPTARPDAAFTPDWAAGAIAEVLRAFHPPVPDEPRFVLVGHSVAGTAVLRLLASPRLRHDLSTLGVSGAVLMGAPDLDRPGWPDTLIELTRVTKEQVELASGLGVLRNRIEASVIAGVSDPDRAALLGEVDRLQAAIEDPERRRASQLLLHRIRPVDDDDVPDWGAIRALVKDEESIALPVLLLWGREDDVVPLDDARRLMTRIRTARLTIIDGARHSPHQERADATSAAILAFARALDPMPDDTGPR